MRNLQRADFVMVTVVLIWGFHFIVLKEAVSNLPPITFNAIRYLFPVPIMLYFAWRHWEVMRISREDFKKLLGLTLLGPMIYQILFVIGIDYTTSTNSALIVATIPTWVAIFSILMGKIAIRSMLIVGILMALGGVTLVVLSGDDAELAFSQNDLLGAGLTAIGIIFLGLYLVRLKPLLDRYNSIGIAIWTHMIVWIGLSIAMIPDLFTLQPSDISVDMLPSFLYSGLLAAGFGRLAINYGIQQLGSARATTYQNFIPLIAAVSALIFLDEALTLGLLFGGLLTMCGVWIVRHYSSTPRAPAPKLAAAGTD